MEEAVFRSLRDNFDLLCEIVREPGRDQKRLADLGKIEKIIHQQIPDALKSNAPEDFYVLYTDFQAEYERFRDFILYEKLIGRNIVALGGGFSSGKSSFLNALMGRIILPEDIDPSTSVPTYIVQGREHEAQGINIFDAQVSLNLRRRDLKKIAHGFGEISDEEDRKITDSVTLGHILKSVFFSTPLHRYEHIAFLDTPGYSKPDTDGYSARTDAQIARGQLNASNYILWFVQAEGGTISGADIDFIRTLREDIPKLIIVSKADKKALPDLRDIVERVKTDLDLKGIRYVDVRPFSSRRRQVDDRDLGFFLDSEALEIRRQLGLWDEARYESNFAWNFKQLFVRCKDYYDGSINEESRKLSRLNRSLTVLSGDDEAMEPLRRMKSDYQKEIAALKEIREAVKNLQTAFFTEIKLISDQVGIDMPEPDEIDLLEVRVRNPLQMLTEYREKHNIRSDPAILEVLRRTMTGLRPLWDRQQGGAEYRAELLDVLKAGCTVKPEDNRLNSVLKNTEAYRRVLAGV